MRIKFITTKISKQELTTMNPIYFWLKSFYMKSGVHFDKYTWLDTEYYYTDDLVDRVCSSTDVLCVSSYIWNRELHDKIIREVRSKKPNIIIITGGPDGKFHLEYSDYVVYGDGELAFTRLLDSFYDNTIDVKSIPNILTKEYKTRHEIFKFSQWDPYSPFIDLKDEFLSDYNKFCDYMGDIGFQNRDLSGRKYKVATSYERARGCPYKCAFCNWQQGLHYKVNRRINDWKEEIDFFFDNDIYIRTTDANTGMYKEDIDMYEYVAEVGKSTGKPNLIQPRNYAKNNKDRVFRLYEIMAQLDPNFAMAVSIQTTHADVLANLQRPEIPWPEHKKMLLDLKAKHPEASFTVELIMGLPGLSKEKVLDTFLEMADIPMVTTGFFEWMLLDDSPAKSPEYRKKYELNTTRTLFPNAYIPKTRKDLQTAAETGLGYFIDMVYNDLETVVYNVALGVLYNDLAKIYRNALTRQVYLDHLNKCDGLDDLVKKTVNRLNKDYEMFGYYVWANVESIGVVSHFYNIFTNFYKEKKVY
jgi:hypothetical protein